MSHPKNRLARERSPYLRQHEDNPVDWYPWGEEALARAKAEDKPILLSVGYSACHWCHVMAHESFEDEAIAAQMSRDFVCIKVDREERPDVDQLYQGVVQLMDQGGGWPLTVFLTPELRPFYGGTYFPPEDRYGRPGFPHVLEALADAWKRRRGELEEQGRRFEEGLGELASYGLSAPATELVPQDVVRVAQALERVVDKGHGGFGGAPKFPNPMNVALLLRGWRRGGGEVLEEAALLTLEKMALGGIYDQLGGGFHRYAVDRYWRVPHFEKMLYDNAQLLHLYAEAQQVAPRPLWEKVVAETAEYLRREMTAPGGGFYASQDADSEGEEGKFFVWTPEELDRAIGAERGELLRLRFGVVEGGNFEHGKTVLEVRLELDALAKRYERSPEEIARALDEARAALFAEREKRVKPGRDDKVLTAWNGLAIRGLAFAGRVFRRGEWIAQARAAADFALAELWDGKRLLRSWGTGIDGFLEDYGDLAAGLTALYQASFEPKYLEAAEQLARAAVERFWDAGKGAYFSAPRGAKDLLVAPYALHDNAAPSGASTLCEAQVALAALTGHREHLDQAERYLRQTASAMKANPMAFGHLWLAADALLDGAAEIGLAGSREEIAPFVEVVAKRYAPTFSIAHLPDGGTLPAILAEANAGRGKVGGKPAAYVCRNFACEPPITEVAELEAKLPSPAGRGSG